MEAPMEAPVEVLVVAPVKAQVEAQQMGAANVQEGGSQCSNVAHPSEEAAEGERGRGAAEVEEMALREFALEEAHGEQYMELVARKQRAVGMADDEGMTGEAADGRGTESALPAGAEVAKPAGQAVLVRASEEAAEREEAAAGEVVAVEAPEGAVVTEAAAPSAAEVADRPTDLPAAVPDVLGGILGFFGVKLPPWAKPPEAPGKAEKGKDVAPVEVVVQR